MPFIFLDTNAYLYSVFSTQEQHDSELLRRLSQILAAGQAKLLLPEIVEMEFLRKRQEMLGFVTNEVRRLKTQIEAISFPTYLASHKQQILVSLDGELRRRERNRDTAERVLPGIFSSTNVIRFPLDTEAVLRAYKRAVRGKRPFRGPTAVDEPAASQLWTADCVITENVIEFFEKNPYQNETLLFCSSNIKDFAHFDATTQKHALHEDIASELRCHTKYFRYLPELIQTEFQVTVEQEGTLQHEQAEDLVERAKWSRVENSLAALVADASHLSGEDIDNLTSLRSLLALDGENRVSAIRQRWPDVIEQVKRRNGLVGSILGSAEPLGLQDSVLVVAFSTDFNRKTAEKATNRQLIETAFERVYGSAYRLRAVVRQQEP